MSRRDEFLSRRELLQRSGLGFGSLALAWMFQQEQARAATTGRAVSFDLTPKQPHFQPRAKAVIQLMQNGGPSQMDLLDPKPGALILPSLGRASAGGVERVELVGGGPLAFVQTGAELQVELNEDHSRGPVPVLAIAGEGLV